MQIVIEIDEDTYKALKKTELILGGMRSGKTFMSVICNAIRNGTPLPKGHGRLIDADSMWNAYHDLDYDFYEAFDLADTIIEADKAESEVSE